MSLSASYFTNILEECSTRSKLILHLKYQNILVFLSEKLKDKLYLLCFQSLHDAEKLEFFSRGIRARYHKVLFQTIANENWLLMYLFVKQSSISHANGKNNNFVS